MKSMGGMRRRWMAAVIALGLSACGAGGRDRRGPAHDLGSSAPTDGGAVPEQPTVYYVYAHDDTTLYKIDPDTLTITPVGAFVWPQSSDQMTDIAIDKQGQMVGISFDKVYSVDKDTAVCTYLADLDRSFNSLSFVPADLIDGSSGKEVVVAAATDGSFYQIDPMTGHSTQLGSYGSSLSSSGDIVSVTGFGTVATAKQPGGTEDWIVRVDPNTGAATLLGNTHTADIWGLGFWKNKIFGFTQGGVFVLLDDKTGAATVVQSGTIAWWGAAVSTAAPVIQ